MTGPIKRLVLDIDWDLYQALEHYAQAHDLAMVEVIRQAVREFLEGKGGE